MIIKDLFKGRVDDWYDNFILGDKSTKQPADKDEGEEEKEEEEKEDEIEKEPTSPVKVVLACNFLVI